jgi:hypothetical protein
LGLLKGGPVLKYIFEHEVNGIQLQVAFLRMKVPPQIIQFLLNQVNTELFEYTQKVSLHDTAELVDLGVLLFVLDEFLFGDEFLDEVVVLGLEDGGVVFEDEGRFCVQDQFLSLP